MSSTSEMQNPRLKDHTAGKWQHADSNTSLAVFKAHDVITLAVCKISYAIFADNPLTGVKHAEVQTGNG